jgi:hypothetical protein
MNRFAAVAVLALVLAVACDDATAPDRDQRQVGGPLFQEVPSDAQCMGTLPPGPTYQNVIVPEGQTCTITGLTITGNITALARSRLMATNNTVGGNIQAVKAERVRVDGGTVGGGISIVEGPGTPPLGFSFPFDYDIRRVRLARDIYLSKNRGFIFVTENTLPTGNITAVENVIDLNAQLNINTNAVEEGGIHVLKNKGGNIRIETNRLPVFGTTPGAGNVIIEDNDIPGAVGTVPAQQLRIAFNRTLQHVQVFKNTGAGNKEVIFNQAGQSIQCKENTTPFVSSGNTAPREEDQCPPLP